VAQAAAADLMWPVPSDRPRISAEAQDTLYPDGYCQFLQELADSSVPSFNLPIAQQLAAAAQCAANVRPSSPQTACDDTQDAGAVAHNSVRSPYSALERQKELNRRAQKRFQQRRYAQIKWYLAVSILRFAQQAQSFRAMQAQWHKLEAELVECKAALDRSEAKVCQQQQLQAELAECKRVLRSFKASSAAGSSCEDVSSLVGWQKYRDFSKSFIPRVSWQVTGLALANQILRIHHILSLDHVLNSACSGCLAQE